ncbi:uncharacterized protein LOC135834533 [Planococcus citri]|uniref:uncharacterized protein LOC135834533 n=1 Tax=Planococcus citri TaxID=170843 RepID=UPI0031F7820A
MNETESNVYDLIYPSPVTLKEISSIVLAVELWSEEISAHIESECLQNLELDLKKSNIRLKNVIPDLPSSTYNFLEEYVDTFGKSIAQWLTYHHDNIFTGCDGSPKSTFLSRFHDFSWDWNGTIHYTRTAKRMMLCDRFTKEEKFKIACVYCFEDDIKRIWPTVRWNMDFRLSRVAFDRFDPMRKFPQLFYWICFLRNNLDKVPKPCYMSTDAATLFNCGSESINHSFLKYFWDRIPSDSDNLAVLVRKRYAIWSQIFCRFILHKLNKHNLERFLSVLGTEFMWFLFKFGDALELCTALRTWKYIQNEISSSHFISYVNKSFQYEAGLGFYAFNRGYLFREIWKSAPQHLKRSAVENVLSKNSLYLLRPWTRSEHRPVKFFIILLQDATVEERNTFWRENWRNFIRWCGADNRDLIELMKLCLQTDNEIALFNKTTMATYENIAEYCVPLLKRGSFEELDVFLSVCCPDVRKKSELKQRLLWMYVDNNSVLTVEVLRKQELLSKFVSDAFQDAGDFGVELFRNQFTLSPITQNCLFECIRWSDLDALMEFVDSFFVDELAVVLLKKHLFECFKGHLINGNCFYKDGVDVQGFLIWLLGSEREVDRLVEDISRKLLPAERSWPREVVYDNDFKNLDNFLMWYFNKDEQEIDKFLIPFYDEMVSFAPKKHRRMEFDDEMASFAPRKRRRIE